MNRWIVLFAVAAFCAFIAMGCSGGGGSPITPAADPVLTSESDHTGQSQTHLWGFYDVYIDIETGVVEAIPNRTVMGVEPNPFNVVQFVNGNPMNLGFDIKDIFVEVDYTDVDIDVSISHPFPGMTEYNGYDVRGLFIGDGSKQMLYNPDLSYADATTDQSMVYPPEPGIPIGYSRWFNPDEFFMVGVGGYTEGAFASPGYEGTATLNPYKYYADDLNVDDNEWDYFNAPIDPMKGRFSAGVTNTRNYYLRFPNATGVLFNYAIIASWGGEDPEFHPTHGGEAMVISDTQTENIYFVDDTDKGGDLILDIGVFEWTGTVTDTMPEYVINIESDVIGGVYELNSTEMISTTPGEPIPIYHVEIPATNISGSGYFDYRVIVESTVFDYTSPYGIPNDAGSDPLAAFFRCSLFVADEPYCQNWSPEIDDINGEEPYIVFPGNYTDWVMTGEWFEDGNPAIDILNAFGLVASATNVQYDDQQHLTFDLDLSTVPHGTYDVRVTNGCGAQLQWTEPGMLIVLDLIDVVGTPNIDISGSGSPVDIAIDPTSDRVAIAYGNNWRRWLNDYSSSTQYSSWSSLPIKRMDANGSFLYYAHTYPGYSGNICWTWTNWNGSIYGSYWSPGNNGMVDITNIQGLNEIWGIFDNNSSNRARWMRNYGIYSYSNYYTYAPWYNGTGTSGVVLANLQGIDFAQYSGGNFKMYFLEALPVTNTGVVELYRVNSGICTYQGISFGEDRFYDPIDITVDSAYNVYVLEENIDGDPVIWAYDSTGALIGTSGPLTAAEISGTPLKIDAHIFKNPDEVHVLHTNGVTRFAM